MPTAVSVPIEQTAFTLTFGGVDFCLTPSSLTDAGQVSFNSSNDGVFCNLQSFTGTLKVSPSAPTDVMTTTAKEITSATVEQEPVSPANAATPASSNAARAAGFSPTQKTLPFTKVAAVTTTKKAPITTKAAPKTTVGNKRSLPDIPTNPVASPLKKEKKLPQEEVPLGQPEDVPTQTSQDSTQADTIIDCSQTDSITSVDHTNHASISSPILQQEESNDSFKTSIERKGNLPPGARWAHTVTDIGNNKLLVYGGQTLDAETGRPQILSDIHVYDSTKKLWYKPVNCEGVARQWHTATFLPERQLLISFGGETINEKTKRLATTDQVMVLDTEIMLWYPPTVSGIIPSGRSGHTATILPDTNELVVFGGVKGTKFQNSLAVLDISRWKWSAPKISGEPPRPRSYHSATAVQGRNGKSQLVIFGGNGPNASFNSVHVLETDGKEWAWINPQVSGSIPLPRTGHCATLLADKKTIIVYGGWDPNDDEFGADDEDKVFGDSYLLDTETWMWSIGPKPTFAGDGSSISHSLVENGGEQRVGHDCVLMEGEGAGAQVLVFGGRIPNDKFTGDFQSLKV